LVEQRGSGKEQEGGVEEGKSIKKRLGVEGDGLGEGGEKREEKGYYLLSLNLRGVGTSDLILAKSKH
jgi:hypothetical protein